VQKNRTALFRGRHFRDHLIVLCVRWCLRHCLTLRDLEELMNGPFRRSFHHRTLGASLCTGTE
jgi:transposase-like protein